MPEARTLKGRLLSFVAFAMAAGPWRGAVERVMQRLGHRYPSNPIVISSCRHFATQLYRRDPDTFARIVTFDTGGQMHCGGTERVAIASTMHYFLGTITGQDEDERPLTELLRRAVRAGDTVFDIGANLGFYSLFLGPICGKSGSVHAFEANPSLVQHLRRSAALNEARANIIVNGVAVGSDDGKMLELYDPDRIGGSSIYRLAWLDTSRSVKVPMTTIDSYRRSNHIERIDVVKIDIEGAELDAFRGMEETFTVCPPLLIACELALLIDPDRSNLPATSSISRGAYARRIIGFLRSRGYEARHVEHHGGLIGRPADPGTLEFDARNLVNVAFVHDRLKRDRPELFET